MTGRDFGALAPLIALGASVLVTLFAITVHRNHRLAFGASLLGLGSSAACIGLALPTAPRPVGPLIIVDSYGLFFVGLLIAAAALVTLAAYGYLRRRQERPEELYLLVQLATFGAAVLALSNHMAPLILGLETLSVSLFALIAYLRAQPKSAEGGVKYLILAGTSSAVLLFGMALVYASTGSLGLPEIGAALGAGQRQPLGIAGVALMLSGLGFKLALVPFHMWTPDVYEAAPAPVTALIATVSKAGVLAAAARLLAELRLEPGSGLYAALAIVAAASMVAGNLLALLARNVKRILAYSSIAQLGYVLVALIAGQELGFHAVSYFLVAYVTTILAAFGVVTALSPADRDADSLDDYRGLCWRRPWLSVVLIASLLSLAGIPITAGFVGKLYVLAAGVGGGLWALVLVLALSSAIGLYYYLRIVAMMVARPIEGADAATERVPAALGAVLGVLLFGIVLLGAYPAPLQRIIVAAMASLGVG